jgi:hypothetical protein
MAKTNGKTYTYKGKCKWARVYKPDQEYDTYGIVVYPDKAGLKQYVKAGHQGEIREDDDGQYVTFRRKANVLIRNGAKKGTVWDKGPPKIVDADGETFDRLIGNGSMVEVTVEVYDTNKGLGTSLERVRVLEHVEYVPQDIE